MEHDQRSRPAGQGRSQPARPPLRHDCPPQRGRDDPKNPQDRELKMIFSLIQLHLSTLAAAAVKLEDVFKSTKENMNQEAGSERLIALGLGALAIIVLLIFLAHRRKT